MFTIGRACTGARSNLGEEVDGHGEALLAHGRRRREAETAVGDQETNIGKAVMLRVLEMRCRSVVEQPATAPSRGSRCIAGCRSGCFDAEVLSDSVTTSTHARAFSATTDEGVSGGAREMLCQRGGQYLDAQKLSCSILPNARRGDPSVEAVSRSR